MSGFFPVLEGGAPLDDIGAVSASRSVIDEIEASQDLVKGQAVYISGWSGVDNIATVTEADNRTEFAQPAVGIMAEDALEDAMGIMIRLGDITEVNTGNNALSSFVGGTGEIWFSGDEIFLGILGKLTNIRPTTYTQSVGVVVRISETEGSISVSIPSGIGTARIIVIDSTPDTFPRHTTEVLLEVGASIVNMPPVDTSFMAGVKFLNRSGGKVTILAFDEGDGTEQIDGVNFISIADNTARTLSPNAAIDGWINEVIPIQATASGSIPIFNSETQTMEDADISATASILNIGDRDLEAGL